MPSGFKLDPNALAKWRVALADLAALTKKNNPEGIQNLAMLSGRRFVKNVASVTPPASGSLAGTAKKKGEDAILGDLLKIALPAQAIGSRRGAREVLASATELLEAHARARIRSSGRVNPRNRKEKLLVALADFNRVLKQLQGLVGWLAAGLNAAASKLGTSLPAWIKRHGNRFGRIAIKLSKAGIRIRIVQNVPFADHVKGYERHWNFALNKEITTLQNQVKAIHARNAARAAARLR